MNIHGLRYSGMTGLANRGWQELWKSLDRLLLATRRQHGTDWRGLSHLVAAPIPKATADGVIDSLTDRFFPAARDPCVPNLLAKHFPDHERNLLSSANQLCGRRFDLLGYSSLNFGDPVDWHFDAVSMKRSSRIHWSRLDPLDEELIGDSKVIWELNRHQWMVQLGQAYCMTENESYALVFVNYVDEWMAENPPGMGINWSSSLELAFRMISWSWAISLFQNSEHFDSEFRARMVSWMAVHANHIERYMSHHYSPNTHLLGEALGLFYAGNVLDGLDGSARWRKAGRRVMLEQACRQISADGVHFERATCYHRYTLEMYLHLIILAKQNSDAVPNSLLEKTEAMLDYLLAIRRPNGSIPDIGDSDGGSLLPLCKRSHDDARGLFSVAAVVFERSDYAWAADGLQPEALWMFGGGVIETFNRIGLSKPNGTPSRAFIDGGYVVMRDGWGCDSHQLIFDVGPLGCPISAGHGHSDLLSIECSVSGVPIIVDPGTYCYPENDGWRSHFRSSQSHSTATVDHVSQARCAGLFSWHDRPAASVNSCHFIGESDYADAEHEAYARLRDPVKHRRRVLFARREYWLIVDDLYGQEEHQVDILFQLASDIFVDHEALEGWLKCCAPSGEQLLVCSFSIYDNDTSIKALDLEKKPAWVATGYGCKDTSHALVCSVDGGLPLRVVTMLVPVVMDDSSPAFPIANVSNGRVRLEFGRDTLLISDDELSLDPSKKVFN